MLSTLIRSIRLVVIIEDLVKVNKPFKSEWDSRRTLILEKIRDLAFVKSGKYLIFSLIISFLTLNRVHQPFPASLQLQGVNLECSQRIT